MDSAEGVDPCPLGYVPSAPVLALAGTFATLVTLAQFRVGKIVLINLFVILPLNWLVISGFILLAPLRFLYNHTINFVLTRLLSFDTIRPTWFEANLKTFTAATIVAYRFVFPGQNILDLSAAVVNAGFHKLFTENPLFAALRQWIRRRVSISTLRSTWFRLAMAYIEIPLLAWWLVGLSWVKFIPLHTPARGTPEHGALTAPGREHVGSATSETSVPVGQIAPKRAHDKNENAVELAYETEPPGPCIGPADVANTAIVVGELTTDAASQPADRQPTVVMHFHKCQFYEQARQQYGDDRGIKSCLNE